MTDFTRILNAEDVRPPHELKVAAIEGNLLFFVGNSLSRLYGYPSWDSFANQLIDELQKTNKAVNYSKAELLKSLPIKTKISIAITGLRSLDLKNKEIEKKIRKALEKNKKQQVGEAYELLSTLSPHFITTNYDEELSEAVELKNTELSKIMPETQKIKIPTKEEHSHFKKSKYKVFKSVKELNESQYLNKKTILHIHGAVSDNESMIVSSSDYLDLYTNSSLMQKLNNFIEDKIIVFCGYGLDEMEILERFIRKTFKKNRKMFLLLPVLSTQQAIISELYKYWRTLGITILPYNIDESGYETILEIIKRWTNELEVLEPSNDKTFEFIDKKIAELKQNPQNLLKITGEIKNAVEDRLEFLHYFLSNIESSVWFNALTELKLIKNMFSEDEVESGYDEQSFNIQLQYLKKVSDAIKNKKIKHVPYCLLFAEYILNFKLEKYTYFSSVNLFKLRMSLPRRYINIKDIKESFDIINSSTDELNNYGAVLIQFFREDFVKSTKNRHFIAEYFYKLFQYEKDEKQESYKSILKLMPGHTLKSLQKNKYLIKEFLTINPKIIDALITKFSSELKKMLDSDFDKFNTFWRPTVKPSSSNRYKESAESIYIEVIYLLAVHSMRKSDEMIKEFLGSKFITTKRLALAILAEKNHVLDAFEIIISEAFTNEIIVEASSVIENYLTSFTITQKKKIVKKIDDINYVKGESKESVAFEKLRWLLAFKNDTEKTHLSLKNSLLKITNGKEPKNNIKHSSRVGFAPVKKVLSKDEMAKLTTVDLAQKLINYESILKSEDYELRDLSRELQLFIQDNLESTNPLLQKFIFSFQFKSAIIDGFTQDISSNSNQRIHQILETIFLDLLSFDESVKQKNHLDWYLSSISRFIIGLSQSSRDAYFDSAIFELAYEISKLCIELSPFELNTTNSNYHNFTINSSTGKSIESYFYTVLALCRILPENENTRKYLIDAFCSHFSFLIDQDETRSVALCTLGFYPQQFEYIKKDFIVKQISKSFFNSDISSWQPFLDGLTHSGKHLVKIFTTLKSYGLLIKYLRQLEDSEDDYDFKELRLRIIDFYLFDYFETKNPLEIFEIIDHLKEIEWLRIISAGNRISKNNNCKDEFFLTLDYLFDSYDENENLFLSAPVFRDLLRTLDFTIKSPDSNLVFKFIKYGLKNIKNNWETSDFLNKIVHSFIELENLDKIAQLFIELPNEAKPSFSKNEIITLYKKLKDSKKHNFIQTAVLFKRSFENAYPNLFWSKEN